MKRDQILDPCGSSREFFMCKWILNANPQLCMHVQSKPEAEHRPCCPGSQSVLACVTIAHCCSLTSGTQGSAGTLWITRWSNAQSLSLVCVRHSDNVKFGVIMEAYNLSKRCLLACGPTQRCFRQSPLPLSVLLVLQVINKNFFAYTDQKKWK